MSSYGCRPLGGGSFVFVTGLAVCVRRVGRHVAAVDRPVPHTLHDTSHQPDWFAKTRRHFRQDPVPRGGPTRWGSATPRARPSQTLKHAAESAVFSRTRPLAAKLGTFSANPKRCVVSEPKGSGPTQTLRSRPDDHPPFPRVVRSLSVWGRTCIPRTNFERAMQHPFGMLG
jgi:hypothetical protein